MEEVMRLAQCHMHTLLDVVANRVEARTHEILEKARASSPEDQEGENPIFR